jgi:nucleotide-binding universal stress UspA family protein
VRDDAERKLASAVDHLTGVAEIETRAVAADSRAHALQEVAEGAEAALIVIGSTHRGRSGARSAAPRPTGCSTARRAP